MKFGVGKARGIVCFLCDPQSLPSLTEGDRLLYIICSPKQMKEILDIESLNPAESSNIRIDPLYDMTLNSACMALHKGYNWFKTRGLDDHQICSCTTLHDDPCYLESIFVSGFLKLPILILSANRNPTMLESCEDFALLDLRSAIESFNQLNFVHARLVFENILRRSRRLINIRIFGLLISVCDFYIAWENFLYIESRKVLRNVLTAIGELVGELKVLTNLKNSLEENRNFLDQLLGELKNSTPCLLVILDTFVKGEHLISLGKFNEAAVRFYRVLEGCIQYRFWKEYGLETKSPDYALLSISRDDLLAKIGEKDLPLHLGFNDGYKILRGLGDSMVTGLDESLLKSVQQSRNMSILIHGFRPIGLKECERARDLARMMLETTFSLYSRSFSGTYLQARPSTLDLSAFVDILS